MGRFTQLNSHQLPQAADKTHHIALQKFPATTQTPPATVANNNPPSLHTIQPPLQQVFAPPSPKPTPTLTKTQQTVQALSKPSQPIPNQLTPSAENSKPMNNPVPVHTNPGITMPTPATLFKDSLGYASEAPTALKATTKVKRELIKNKLQAMDKVYGEAIDNGDCFFHSFAQLLNVYRLKKGEKPVTIAQLRSQEAEYAKTHEWVKTLCTASSDISPEGYSRYVKEVSFVAPRIKAPVWGHPQRDGRILCELYNVNLITYLADIQDITKTEAEEALSNGTKMTALLSNDDRCIFGPDGNDSVTIPSGKATLEIVVYPKHYMPVFKKSDLA